MVTAHNDANDPLARPKISRPRGSAYRWWEDRDAGIVQERSAEQLRLIRQALDDKGIPAQGGPRDPDHVEYLYRPGAVLTRSSDAGRVADVVAGRNPEHLAGPQEQPELRRGPLTRVSVPRLRDDVEDWFDYLDSELGPGVATPDHLLHTTTWCNAIEPLPTRARMPQGTNRDVESDGRDGLVVVVDTGLRRDVVDAHPWLVNVDGDDEVPGVGHYSGHGTFIAGVVRTYAPRSQVYVERVFEEGGVSYESDMVEGLVRALERAPDVISFSGGTRTRHDLPLLSFRSFYEDHLRHVKGTAFVTAAGNDGDRGPFWPAAFPWAVAVGALDEDGLGRAGFSDHGSWVDVYALGSEVINAFPKETYTYREPPRVGQEATFDNGMAAWSGTSFASPMVAGLIVARMTWSGESASDAAAALIEAGRRDAGIGVGARLRSAAAAARVVG